MNFILDTCLPLLVVFVMTLVGLELAKADFARLRNYPRAIVLALVTQAVLPPVAAVSIALAMSLPAAAAGGLLIIGAAPIAALSNFYALLARADLALAVTLTAISTAAASVTMPAAVALGFALLNLTGAGIEVPLAKLVQQTILGVLVPILAGMTIRALAPDWVERQRRRLQAFGLLALLAIIAAIVTDQFATIVEQFAMLAAAALLFTMLMLAAGWAMGRFARDASMQRRALLFGFPARNVSIATLVAIAVFRRPDMASIGVIFFIVQAAILIALALRLSAAERALRK
jgi:bile acid:Na+ symporter, BASS family